jgi:hypothetical protein
MKGCKALKINGKINKPEQRGTKNRQTLSPPELIQGDPSKPHAVSAAGLFHWMVRP